MKIYGVYIINRAGGLIFSRDSSPKIEIEKTFSYPIDIKFKSYDEKVVVAFGQRDGIKVGHVVLSINGIESGFREDGRGFNMTKLKDGREIFKLLEDESAYPLSIKFGRLRMTANEKIMLLSMFHSIFAMSVQLSPVLKSSGIEVLEADTFKLHCFQTKTGIKLIVITDPRCTDMNVFLKKLYELYADYALKNPFYENEMPIKCPLFEEKLTQIIDASERVSN